MPLSGESWRIVASIIKNARDDGVMKAILEHKLGESLLYLFQSKHMIMKNEAILSLIILTSSLGIICKLVATSVLITY